MLTQEQTLKLAKQHDMTYGVKILPGSPLFNNPEWLTDFARACYAAGEAAMREMAAKVCDELVSPSEYTLTEIPMWDIGTKPIRTSKIYPDDGGAEIVHDDGSKPQQEPVTWMRRRLSSGGVGFGGGVIVEFSEQPFGGFDDPARCDKSITAEPLYTSLQPLKPLSAEEIVNISLVMDMAYERDGELMQPLQEDVPMTDRFLAFARAVEAKQGVGNEQ